MPKRPPKPTAENVRLRLRIFSGEDIALGPGKAELLKLVRETGSIRQAAAAMDMSYMRAWELIRTMNRCFRKPVVEAVRGGARRGGAKVTETGALVVALYEQLEKESLKATTATRRKLAGMLRKSGKRESGKAKTEST